MKALGYMIARKILISQELTTTINILILNYI